MTVAKNPIEDDPRIEMLQEPLATEDGFLNEACIKELNAAILNTPETHERLAGNPEWSTAFWTSDIDIIGALADSAVQCHGGAPLKLESVTNYVMACLRSGPFKDNRCDGEHDRFRLAELSLCDINRLLWGYLRDLKDFNDWNEEKIVGKNWIDLSACLHNVCISIRDGRRHNVAFDMGFERDHGKDD